MSLDESNNSRRWDFDPLARGYDRTVAEAAGVHARYDKVLDTVADRAEITPGDRVLDIGTGTGNLALRCAAMGGVVTGLDPSVAMLRKAREKTSSDLDVTYRQSAGPFLHIPYPDGSFDAVVSSYAFHHVPTCDKPAAVREMLRVLAPGGTWVLGDLVFINAAAEAEALRRFDWLEEEYFARLDELCPRFVMNGLALRSQQLTPVSWVLWARKV